MSTATRPRYCGEVSSNHCGSLDRALHFIDVCAGIGFDAIKFQFFTDWSDIYAQGHRPPNLSDRACLPMSWLNPLRCRAEERGIDLGVTPFTEEVPLVVLARYVTFLKISSYQILLLDLIERCARTKKPLVISTGMANLDEINKAVIAARTGLEDKDITLLHCVSAYPTPLSQCNLKAIKTLREIYPEHKIGWSCHIAGATDGYEAMNTAHLLGVDMIEMHVDLDRGGLEWKGRHCWLTEWAASWTEKTVDEHFYYDKECIEALGYDMELPPACEKDEAKWRHDPTDGLRPRLWART